jgi:acetyl-CoA carboxylase carboxyl transferase subunit alpha
MMFENSVYSVISPEGCAAILWKDAAKASKAAEALRITAFDLKQLGIVDEVLSEPDGGAHRSPLQTAQTLKAAIIHNLQKLQTMTKGDRQERRYQKFRKMGLFLEPEL